MKQFSFLDHTADIRMLVEASSLKELLESALEGMNSILYDSDANQTQACDELVVSIKAIDITAMLIDFLSEVLSHSHINTALYSITKYLNLSDTQIHAELSCRKLQYFNEDIKAVTYHEAKLITNQKGNFETMIVFDI